MAPVTSSLAMSDYGLRPEDVKYFSVYSQIRGKGPDRLKYLDLEGRWVLSGKSIPYISAAFNHLQTLNHAREIIDQPLNAIGMVGWTPSSEPVELPPKQKAPPKLVRPPVYVDDEEVPPSPREVVPHRSAGYGAAHQKRKLSVPDRSRSASPHKQQQTLTDYDPYAKYERNRKESITRYGTRWGDAGYGSASPSPTGDYDRPPHRTPSLSPRSGRDRSAKTELSVRTSRDQEKAGNVPYRTHGYGSYHEKRQYDLSPRSIGSYSSESEQNSPTPSYERNADEVLLLAYHSRGRLPRVQRAL